MLLKLAPLSSGSALRRHQPLFLSILYAHLIIIYQLLDIFQLRKDPFFFFDLYNRGSRRTRDEDSVLMFCYDMSYRNHVISHLLSSVHNQRRRL